MDLYGHLMEEVYDGAAQRSEDYVFSPQQNPPQPIKKGSQHMPQPLDVIGSGG